MGRHVLGRRVIRHVGAVVLVFMISVPCASAWTWPVNGPVLQTFSFDPAHPYAAGQHRGIAIGADAATPVLAAASGVVSFAGSVPTNGLTLTIQTGDGLAVSLTHLGSIDVARDAHVVEGSVVGTVGPSGTAEFATPYVHLGIRTASSDQGCARAGAPGAGEGALGAGEGVAVGCSGRAGGHRLAGRGSRGVGSRRLGSRSAAGRGPGC